jgi:hypothetical protein
MPTGYRSDSKKRTADDYREEGFTLALQMVTEYCEARRKLWSNDPRNFQKQEEARFIEKWAEVWMNKSLKDYLKTTKGK